LVQAAEAGDTTAVSTTLASSKAVRRAVYRGLAFMGHLIGLGRQRAGKVNEARGTQSSLTAACI
jgi:hypothetical protein